MARPPGGAQQWMCAMVVGLTRPAKATFTVSRLVTVSTVTTAEPMPGEPVGGTSFAPVSVAVSTMTSARASTDNAERASAKASALNIRFIAYLRQRSGGQPAPQPAGKGGQPGWPVTGTQDTARADS